MHYSRARLEWIVVVVSGASGVRYGLRLLEVLSKTGIRLDAVYTRAAEVVARHEERITLPEVLGKFARRVYSEDEIDAPIASSSNTPDAVIVAPCSTTFMAKLAHGIGDTLATRVALNTLRMRRMLILVVRETPLSPIDLLNATILSFAGAIVLPAAPGFYHEPKTVDDMVDFVVGKVLDTLGIEHKLYKRWRHNMSSST